MVYIHHFFRILMNQAVKRAMALPGMFTSTWMIKWRNLNKREQCDVCDVELFTQKQQQRNMWRTLKKHPRFLVMHFETLCDINCCRTRALLQWFVSRDTGSFTAKHLYGLWRGCPLTGGRTMSLILFKAEHKVLASILQPFEAFPGLLTSLMTHSRKWFFIQSFKESQISIFSMGFLSSGPLTAELFAEAKDIFLEHMKDQKGSRCDSSCSSSVALLCFSLDCHGQPFLHKRCCFGYSKGFYILTEVHLLTSFRCNSTLPFLATVDWWCNHCSFFVDCEKNRKDSSTNGSWNFFSQDLFPLGCFFPLGFRKGFPPKKAKQHFSGVFWPFMALFLRIFPGEAGRFFQRSLRWDTRETHGGCDGLYVGRKDEQSRMLEIVKSNALRKIWSYWTKTAKTWRFFEHKIWFNAAIKEPFFLDVFDCPQLPKSRQPAITVRRSLAECCGTGVPTAANCGFWSCGKFGIYTIFCFAFWRMFSSYRHSLPSILLLTRALQMQGRKIVESK